MFASAVDAYTQICVCVSCDTKRIGAAKRENEKKKKNNKDAVQAAEDAENVDDGAKP